jgi:hypothetical protein
MRGNKRRICGLAAFLATLSLLAALSGSADAARSATAPEWGLPSSLAHSRSAAHRLMAARLRTIERAVMRRHGHAVASRAAARPDITASGFEGTVTDSATKAGVTGIEVCAYDIEFLEKGLYQDEELEPACGTVLESSGHYRIGVPAGEYYVEFFDPSRNYIPQFYDARSVAESPDPVVVKAKPVTPEINAALVEGGRIEGAVTAAEGGTPLTGVLACAFDVEAGGFGCAETGSEGKYRIRGLPTGTYEVIFLVPPVAGLNYLDQPLEGVAVTAGQTTTGANGALPSGGEVKGTVTAAWNGATLEGIIVCAFPSDAFGEEAEELEECTSSGAHGGYTIERLQPGSYFVEFFGLPLYATQFYDGATYGSSLLAGAVALNVTPPAPTTGIDGTMLRVGEEPPKPTVPPVVNSQTSQTTTPNPTPPVPTVGVLSTKAVLPALTAESRVTVSGRRASVKLRCRVGPCKGTLTLTITVAKKIRSNGRTVTRHVTLVVGSGSFSLAQGASGTATIRLTAQGAKLLASAARHPQAGKLKLVLKGAKTTQRAVSVR